MKYLEREPRMGDRVRVDFEGTYGTSSGKSVLWLHAGAGPSSACVSGDRPHVRVIAPEPRVGDVVTADMDLPDGSIIEGKQREGWTSLLKRRNDGWFGHGLANRDEPYFSGATTWRIVRIGPAQ